jgi:hypothetical protein
MSTIKRIFRVIEIGQKDALVSDLEFCNSEPVEVVDLTTRNHNMIKAGEVSIYRHFLQRGGKLFNILGLRETRCYS